MKLGKYIPLGSYKNIKVGYGTVDHKNLKTIYLKFNSWIEPEKDINKYDSILNHIKKEIKLLIYNRNYENFHRSSIVDLDVKTSGMKINKRSFMDLEITLFVTNSFNVKDLDMKHKINNIIREVIDLCVLSNTHFTHHKKKNSI